MDTEPGSTSEGRDRDPGAGYRVALIHHNTLLRAGLCHIFQGAGHEVVWQAGDGTAIVDHLAETSPDVIVLAWEAPGVDVALVETLAASPIEAPVVILSRPDTDSDLTAILEAGAAGCLSANLGADDFLASLGMIAQGDMLVSHDMVPVVTNPPGDAQQLQDRLTPRELEVLRALGRGATNQEIAEEMFISQHTVKIHVRRILAKMELRNRQQAAAFAAAEGLI